MDEQTLAKLIRETVSQEINSLMQEMKAELDKIRSEMATKEDLKAFVTKEDLKQFATKEDLKQFATKEDLKQFATKEDLKAFATKEDLKAFATKEDLKPFATKEDLKQFATKEDFLEFERRLNSAIEKIREGVRLYILDLEREIVEIKSKLRFYDFDYIARQNDAMIKILKDLYEEKTIISEKLKEHEKRITDIETIAKIV
jgi:hypothetical protein